MNGWTSLMITRPPGRTDSRELRYGLADLGQVHHRERADGDIDGFGLQGQRFEVAFTELALRELQARLREHSGGTIHADDAVPARREVGAVTAGPARRIEHDRGRQRIEQPVQGRLLDREKAERLVIGVRPEPVTFGDVVFGRRKRGGELGRVVDALKQGAHLVYSRPACQSIIAKRQTQQRQALDPEQQFTESRFRIHRSPPQGPPERIGSFHHLTADLPAGEAVFEGTRGHQPRRRRACPLARA